MSDSILQVNQIKDKGGNATGITVADSSANVTIGNLTATSLAGGTIASGVTFPAGHTLQIVNNTNGYNTDVSSTSYTVVDSASGVDWEPQIDMLKSTSKLLAIFSLALVGVRNGAAEGRGCFELEQKIASGGWTTAVTGSEAWGAYDYGVGGGVGGGIWSPMMGSIQHYTFPNTTGIVKYRLKIRCTDASATVRHGGDGGTTNRQSQVTFIEIQG